MATGKKAETGRTEADRKQGDRGDHQGLSRAKAQRGKNLAVLFALIAFVALIYIVAIVRMGGNG